MGGKLKMPPHVRIQCINSPFSCGTNGSYCVLTGVGMKYITLVVSSLYQPVALLDKSGERVL